MRKVNKAEDGLWQQKNRETGRKTELSITYIAAGEEEEGEKGEEKEEEKEKIGEGGGGEENEERLRKAQNIKSQKSQRERRENSTHPRGKQLTSSQSNRRALVQNPQLLLNTLVADTNPHYWLVVTKALNSPQTFLCPSL